MKILEAQSATLTNFEVYAHVLEQKARYARREVKGRRPGNLETVVHEVCVVTYPKFRALLNLSQLLEYFREAPSPLGSEPFPYNETTIRTLLQRLRPWDFSKAEVLMILNLRPTKPANLTTIVEEMEVRFPSEDTQNEIVAVIADVLGRPNVEAERQVMTENAKEARKEQVEQEDGMLVDD